MRVAIIGGGIIGLCSAYYLKKSGFSVTIIDKKDFTDNCSYGNMGFICPSHFIPLATPGIVKQGIKWMLNSSSPFYIKPRLNLDLIRWGMAFYQSANKNTLEKNIPHLSNLLQLSRKLVVEIKENIGNHFDFKENGCWMLFKEEKTAKHEHYLAKIANDYNLKTSIYDKAGIEEIENKEVNVLGGVFYYDDAYVEPGKLMTTLLKFLKDEGVNFLANANIKSFETSNQKATAILYDNEKLETDYIIVANGSQMPEILNMLGKRILMQAGKGYSYVYNALDKNLNLPAVLVDHRVACSPYGSMLRIGGTMEISGHNNRRLPQRIKAIYDSVKQYYPSLPISEPIVEKAWFGYRPLSPDGLPYIGNINNYTNILVAGGHAMLGVATSMGTGYLIDQMVRKQKTIIDTNAFNPQRFS